MRKISSAASWVCATCERERTGVGDGLQEEARGDPCGEAHLARLEDDVARAAALLEGTLRGVGQKRRGRAIAGAHAQEARGERHGDGVSAEARRTAVENGAEAEKFLAVVGEEDGFGC